MLTNIIGGLALLQKIGEAENQKKFQEEIVKGMQNFASQINEINADQMSQISDILTKFQWIQYGIILVLVILSISLGYFYLSLLKRVRLLELQQK